jgi:hypothetical protein
MGVGIHRADDRSSRMPLGPAPFMTGRRTIARVAAAVVAIALLGEIDAASLQAPQARFEALTPDEATRGRVFAQAFVRRLAQTRDLGPLVPDYFVRDFSDRLATLLAATGDVAVDLKGLTLFWPDAALVASLSRETLVEYYVAHVNFWYLVNLYNVSRRTPQELQAVRTFDGGLPIAVSARLYGNDLFRALLARPMGVAMSDGPDSGKETVTSADRLTSGVVTLDLASELLRGDLERPPAETTPTYRQMSRLFDDAAARAQGPSVLSRAMTCAANCGGLPAGTRVIEVAVLPSLHLHMLDVNRQMRIFFIDLPVG